jgi:hypothetical protein
LAGYYRVLPGDRCLYCGQKATCRDHFLPVSISAALDGNVPHRLKVLIPSCTECNKIAGARLFKSFGAKRKHIQNELRRKYAKLLNAPSWNGGELNTLGRDLRERVIWLLKRKHRLERRVSWRNARNVPPDLLNESPGSDFAADNAIPNTTPP